MKKSGVFFIDYSIIKISYVIDGGFSNFFLLLCELMFTKLNFLKKRIKRLTGFGYLLQMVPFAKAVILTGSMAFGAAKPASDIDLLIVVRPKRLYTARFFATIWNAFTGHRRKPFEKNVVGKFCINHFMTTENFTILPHTEANARAHRFMVKVWDREGEHERLMRENFWMRKYQLSPADVDQLEFIQSGFPLEKPVFFAVFRRIWEWILAGKFGDLVEGRLAKWQKDKIASGMGQLDSTSEIYISDTDLRLWGREF